MASLDPHSDDGHAPRAVFLSYAREDTAAALRIAEALRSQGVEVWFDQSELRGGDAWDQKIRRQIKECALFMPVISGRTQERGEGYFRLEWKLAVERTHLMAEGVPFLAPVVVDATPENAALVPAEFLRVQWIRLPGSLPTPQFVEQIKRMVERPRKFGGSVAPIPTAAAQPQQSRHWIIGAVCVAIVAAAVAVVVTRRPPAAPAAAAQSSGPPAAPAPQVDAKSIAVLPFENMSEDKENGFFTDGVHEDVLTNLSFIKDLHVVSRTSVMQYRGTTKSIKQIGQELGVAYVLEGSVRREGNKVRVTGQLIDARTDEHVWAKAYDKDLTDIFAIQGELAQAIAEALQAVLAPEARVLLERRPTENSAAYDDYLKARQLRDSSGIGGVDEAVPFLEDAVRLDPNFAAAWADLGSMRAFAHFNGKPREEPNMAKVAIDTAVRLAPDDPAVIEGLGDYYYYEYRDYTRATEQYLRLAVIRPNDPAMYFSLGLIQRRQGRLADAIPNFRRAVKLDPTNLNYVGNFAGTLLAAREYDEAEPMIRKYRGAYPSNLEAAWGLCLVAFNARGSTEEIHAFAKLADEPSQRDKHLYLQNGLAGLCGDWDEVIRLDRLQRYYERDAQNPRWNQDVFTAEVFAESGDMAAARARATEAMALMKADLARRPDDSVLFADMSLAHALLGEKDEAFLCAQKSAELMPESRDAILGPGNSYTCALGLAWLGEKDRALAELERLLHVPWGATLYPTRAAWRPLRDDPRFKALVSDPRNNDPLL
jgi:TolB-like protein/Tfp pilus assembly protein PilF